MDMEQRKQLFAIISEGEAHSDTLGNFDDGWDSFDASVRNQFGVITDLAFNDAALKKALISAHKEVNESGGELARRRFKIIRQIYADRKERIIPGVVGGARSKLESNKPPVLTAAIKRMEQALEFARGLGKSQFTFSGVPGGGETLTSAKGRTAEDEKATQRIEAALHKMRGLVFVPGDLQQLIAEVVKEADIGSIWTGLPAAPAPKESFDPLRALKGPLIAELVPDTTPPRRERLMPAG